MKGTLAYVLIAVAAVLAAYLFSSIFNYRKNKKAAVPQKYIFNQTGEETSKYRYGFFRSSYNGCGWIAVYNALSLLGKEPKTEKIISELEWTAALLFGVFGTVPFGVAGYFRRRGYKVKITYKSGNYDNAAKNGDVSIVWYFHAKGAHFVTLKWDGENFVGYNTYSNSLCPDNWGKSVSDNLIRRKKHPVMLITVSKKFSSR